MVETCQMAVSKPNRNRLWRLGSARDSSFEGQQKQVVAPCEVSYGKAAKRRRNRLGEGFEGFKAFKRRWKRARWQFRSTIETGCGAAEVPDSSFKAPIETGCGARKCQIAASKPNRNRSWRRGRSHGKAAKRRRKLPGGF